MSGHWSDIVAAAVRASWERRQEWDVRQELHRQRKARSTAAPRSCVAAGVITGGADGTGVLYTSGGNDAVSRQYESTPPHANRNEMEQED